MQYFWENPEWEDTDPHLKRIKEMPFQRSFPFIPSEKGLYIIRGPRQIGKSSWLKTVLSHYSKADECFYLSCENIENNKELAEILKSIRGRKVILLDEVSFVTNWDRAIKHEVDLGQHHIIMITGSHSYDLKRGSDLMPGRFDGGGEFLLLPMLFDEFYEARLQAGWASDDRVKELELYFRVGGFPAAVAEAGIEGKLPKKSLQTYWKWLVGDAIKLGKREAYLEEVIIQLAQSMQTPLSLQTLAKKTSIGSHHTVKDYITLLESCFAIRTLYAIDMNSGAYRYKKDKKFYFTDPLLFWLGMSLSGKKIKDNFDAALAEMVAHEELKREHSRFGYINGRSGEVDFILPGEWAVEVKWSNDARNLSKAYLNLSLLNKKVWLKNNFLI
jgi:predicted AAA+ superfamily ATPase